MDDVCGLRDREEMWRLDHLDRHAATELLDLATYVFKEGVAAPSADEHDGVYRDLVETHRQQ